MLAYLATKSDFLKDAPVIEDVIRDAVRKNLNLDVAQSEYLSWRNSLGNAMSHVMHDSRIPKDAGIAIEYRLNGRRFRLDFVVSGSNSTGQESVVIVELKQWTDVSFSSLEDHVMTALGGGIRDTTHPSYQAWSYKSHLEQFNEYVYENSVNVAACAYLHNCKESSVISSSRYENALRLAPVFLNGQSSELADLIVDSISTGTGTDLLRRIDAARVRPSKPLADAVGSMLVGHEEFVLLDDQKTTYEKILSCAAEGTRSKKNVVIVKGGPGTGKSVIAINALANLTGQRLSAKYVTANAAPRTVFESKLKKILKGDAIKHLFSGSGSFTETTANSFDVLIVDEAHRLRMKSGMFKNLGEDQVKEIINSAQTSVFFIDEAQKVTWLDVGEISRIKAIAAELGAEVYIQELNSQFRCSGSDDYMLWLDDALGVSKHDDHYFSTKNFDFKIVDSPVELHKMIREKNRENGKSRMVAVYCWDWVSKKSPSAFDIQVGEYKAQWNLASYGNEWIINPESVEEVGCIHTCQGLELDYVGVIIGDDLIFDGKTLVTDPAARAKTDASLNGFKKESKENPEVARQKADELIRNTYRTLMSRGMKGCYVYFTNKETEEYFRGLMPVES